MSNIKTIAIAIFIMIPVTLLTKKLLKNFDDIEIKEDDSKD